MKLVFRRLSFLLGPLFLLIILTYVDLASLLGYLKGIKGQYIALAVAILFHFHLLKSLRWRRILSAQNIELSFRNSYWMYLSALFWGLATPGRVGDFSKAWYLQRLGHKGGAAVACSLLDRMLDTAFLGAAGMVALVWLWIRVPDFHLFFVYALAISGFIFILSLGGLVFFRLTRSRAVPAAVSAGRTTSAWRQLWHDFQHSFGQIPLLYWLEYVFLTLGTWLVYFLVVHLLVWSTRLELGLLETIFFFIVATIAGLIPVSIAGIGTRDACLVLLFKLYGRSSAEALAFSLCILFIYVVTAVFGLVAYSVWHGGGKGKPPPFPTNVR